MSYKDWETVLTENFDETVSWRRQMHRHPELSFQENATRQYIYDKLKEFGYTNVKLNVGTGGVTARLEGAFPGPVIAFRADFDALPIQEETGLPFASENAGVMHACGHDGHTATLLSVAKVVRSFQKELKGAIVFLFQHAEEKGGGAASMIEDGVLEDVDYVYGLHLRSPLEFGKIQYCSGPAMAAVDAFEIKIQGKGGHGAHPNETIDPIVVGSHLVNQLQTLVSRRKDPKKAGVVTVATFKAGTKADNIIADTALIGGTVRTFDPDLRELFAVKITSMAEAVCAAHDATCTIAYMRGYPAVNNHPKETGLLKQLFIDKFGELGVESTAPQMLSEDFAYYLEKKPGSFFFVNSGNAAKGIIYPHHHPKFDFDEQAMLVGGKAFLSIVEYYLTVDRTATSLDELTAGKLSKP